MRISGLTDKSTRPKQVRQRNWPKAVIEEISRLRRTYPNLGKEKLYCLLEPFCLERQLVCPKPRTISRIMADAPDKMRHAPLKIRPNGKIVTRKKNIHKARKPKGFKALYPGHCVSLDTVERFIDGCQRYVITFVDLHSRFSFVWATHSHASAAAKEFFELVTEVFPYSIDYVLTDNGSEFMKDFEQKLKDLHLIHWHTYPKTPKMNAHCERFNRTIQEEFIDYHLDDLIEPNQNSLIICFGSTPKDLIGDLILSRPFSS